MNKFSLDLDDLTNIDGIPQDNLTFKINYEDLDIDFDDELGHGSFAQVCDINNIKKYIKYYLFIVIICRLKK